MITNSLNALLMVNAFISLAATKIFYLSAPIMKSKSLPFPSFLLVIILTDLTNDQLPGRRLHERPMNTPVIANGATIVSATIQAMPVHDLLHFTPSGSCTGRFVNDTIFKYPLLVSDRPADRAL